MPLTTSLKSKCRFCYSNITQIYYNNTKSAAVAPDYIRIQLPLHGLYRDFIFFFNCLH